ncbi:TPA: hypothetical protein I9Y37_001909 [Citrobacter freundii]|nr:hypothetical protein [Citrobacter freundii]HAT3963884.1 hypothetical protein [Citrobacter freundii]
MMTKLYCPECGNYLEGGDGLNHDCPCGWKQPEQASDLACGGCGNEHAEYVTNCPHCSSEKCNLCDAGDDVECGNCDD